MPEMIGLDFTRYFKKSEQVIWAVKKKSPRKGAEGSSGWGSEGYKFIG